MTMEDSLRLLILEAARRTQDPRLGVGIGRVKVLKEVSSLGGKVLHDSGGRLIVINTSEMDEALFARIPGARLVPLDASVKDLVQDLDENESLFVEALRIRTSPRYRDLKARQKPGETPEEQALFTAPCILEE
jgi:hypothetical protein